LRVYAVVTLGLTAAYLASPPRLRPVVFLLATFATMPGAALAVRRSQPTDRLAWSFFLAGLAALNVGNVLWSVYVDVQHHPTGDGTLGDFVISLGYVLFLAGAVTIVVRRGRNDVGGLIDATIVSLALGGLLWDFVLLPRLTSIGAPLATQMLVFADMFVLSGVLGALGRLWITAGQRIPALRFLLIAVLFSLAGNVAVVLVSDPVTGARPDWTNVIYLIAYVAVGAVALHPSSALLFEPGPPTREDFSAGRLVFLGAALALTPVVGGWRALLGRPTDGLLLAAGSAALIALVMVRIARLAAQRARAEQALAHQAAHDALTGLPNRRQFMARLAERLDHARAGGACGVVVLFCDLDGFKDVNDRLGHAVGDELLVGVAERLQACVRRGDVVSRFGGDEFLILCDAESSDEVADGVCRRIKEELGRPFELAGERVTVGASVGAAVADRSTHAEDLVHRADQAMYAAKQRKSSVPAFNIVVA